MARSRNRPRRGLAWLIVLALVLLILAATRASASPGRPVADPADAVDTETDAEADTEAETETDADTDADADADADADTDTDTDAASDLEADAEPSTALAGAGDVAVDANPNDIDPLDDLLEPGAFDFDSIDGTAFADAAVFTDPAFAGGPELRDLALHRRPSRWGRLDLSIAWRRRWRLSEPHDVSVVAATSPTIAGLSHIDALWLVATWRI